MINATEIECKTLDNKKKDFIDYIKRSTRTNHIPILLFFEYKLTKEYGYYLGLTDIEMNDAVLEAAGEE